MAAPDDLNAPLGVGGPHKPQRQRPSYRLILLAAAGLLAFGGVIGLNRYGDPLGGEPHVVATIAPPAPHTASKHAGAGQDRKHVLVDDLPTGTIAPPAGDDTAADMERKSGVKVIRGGGGKVPGALIIDVPEALAHRLAPAPDSRLVEKSRYGLLPHVGPDGSRAADVYARPWPANTISKPNMPHIALVVGGLGLNPEATRQAIRDLPGSVTLAFAPYGKDLAQEVAQARNAGHEVILQLPMEPFDYPHTNPGPHTLLTSSSVAQNTENLHWLMSRFTGYAGVANFLGAKFTASPDRFRPILQEIADRGLFYVDDGTSARSVGLSLAKAIGLPAVRVDVTLDAGDEAQPIEANLATLEKIARAKDFAIGMVSDLPANVEKVADFTKMAKARGIMLVPLSAAVRYTKAQDMSAQDERVFPNQ